MKISYSRQHINSEDENAVLKALRSDFLTQGPAVPKFEKKVAQYCGALYASAMNSATSALHISCLALGLSKNDILWTSANTFVASANCALYCGAKIDFVDIDPATYNMSVQDLSKKLIKAKKINKLPKIVVPVHFAGQPCDMPEIYKLSKKYKFKIIEDASHALGASINNVKIGSCSYSDITVFSFHPIKIITSIEGGMALTNKKDLALKLSRLRTHGITSDKTKMHKRPQNEIWNYQMIELGYNYRLNDVQASLGLSQMKRLDSGIKRRHKIANYYDKALKDLPIETPWQSPKVYSSYHLYPILIKEKFIQKKHKQIHDELIKYGILVNLHYIPVHRHPYYENLGFKKNTFPNSENFHKKALSIPMYPALKTTQLKHIVKILKKVLIRHSKKN